MKDLFKKKLSINEGVSLLIPALNEEKTIEEVVERCAQQPIVTQLIIINDGSTDNTKGVLEKIEKRFKPGDQKSGVKITVIHHSKNQGKGAAIKNGLSKALGKYIMVQDADLEYFPEEIQKLFQKAEHNKDGIVFGSRAKSRKKSYFLAILGNIYLSTMFNLLFGFRLDDSYTCYKLMPRKVWQRLNLQLTGFEIDAELIAKLGMLGYKIEETPISYNPRKYSQGKKIKWTDLLKATSAALKIRFLKDIKKTLPLNDEVYLPATDPTDPLSVHIASENFSK